MMFRAIALVAICLLLGLSPADGAESGKQDPKKEWVDIKKAGKPIKPNIPPEYNNLVKAFDQYWNAVKDKKYDVAYSLESSEYKKGISLEKYKAEKILKSGKTEVEVKIVSVRALEIKKLNEKEVVVQGMIAYKAGFVDNIKPVEDKWINEEKGWKHILSN